MSSTITAEEVVSKYPMTTEEVISMCPMPHHTRQPLCDSRSAYRRGRRETAVKVFTISDESKYLLIQRVPDIKGDVKQDLYRLCQRFGTIDRLVLVNYPDCEPFTRTYLIRYNRFVNAVRAKKSLDDYNFLGSVLHVCYAPEMETIDDTREKLRLRKEYVNKVVNSSKKQSTQALASEEMETSDQTVAQNDDKKAFQSTTESAGNMTSKRKFREMIEELTESEVKSEPKPCEQKKIPRIKWRNKDVKTLD